VLTENRQKTLLGRKISCPLQKTQNKKSIVENEKKMASHVWIISALLEEKSGWPL